MEMSKVSRQEITNRVRQRYPLANKKQKAKILDEFVANTGYNRKYAIHLITRPSRSQPKKKRRRPRTYTVSLIQPLTFIWKTCRCICSKRLQPFLPEMVCVLERLEYLHPSEEDRQLLATISASTIDRLLKPIRDQSGRRGKSTTKAGAWLKKAIPIHTYTPWNEQRPGFLEIDLVAHCGESASGDYLCTLNTVDIATGWSECIAPANRGQHAVFEALKALRERLPFPLLGIDSDNDGSFINELLFRYCQAEKITFTRCRPYKKNDQAHVEQKNGSIVRQLIGYDRYETWAAAQFHALYRDLRLYTNFFQPVIKLKEKTRVDGKVKKVYDEAQTPYRRVLASPDVRPEDKDRLTKLYETLDPVALQKAIDQRAHDLWEKCRVRFLDDATNAS